MNELSIEKKILIASMLVEGNSIRSIERITGVHRDTIMRLGVSLGERAQEFLDKYLVNLKCNFIEMDEIWGYVGKKRKNLSQQEKKDNEVGDQWIFVALDADTKLVVFYSVGKRTALRATEMMEELKQRITSKFQLSTDSFSPYFDAVDSTFGNNIDYAQIHKHYKNNYEGTKRYSPANIIRVTKKMMLGDPNLHRVSTSYVERQNLTMRMQMRRLTRLTNAFSKKLYNLQCAVSLHFFHYNFMRIHQTLRVTPAMESGITNHLWNWYDFLGISNINTKAA